MIIIISNYDKQKYTNDNTKMSRYSIGIQIEICSDAHEYNYAYPEIIFVKFLSILKISNDVLLPL